MKTKIIALSLAMILSLTTIAFAASINGSFQGNPIANVFINGTKLIFPDVPAIIYGGRTMMPLRACVEAVNGIVEWENATQTAKIIKPETNIYFVVYTDDGQTIKDVYYNAPTITDAKEFYSFVYISGIPKGTYTVKCEFVTSEGKALHVETKEVNEGLTVDIKNDNENSYIFIAWEGLEIVPGTYRFRVHMKDEAGNYKVIAVKTMLY